MDGLLRPYHRAGLGSRAGLHQWIGPIPAVIKIKQNALVKTLISLCLALDFFLFGLKYY